jgi:hypothetical protein
VGRGNTFGKIIDMFEKEKYSEDEKIKANSKLIIEERLKQEKNYQLLMNQLVAKRTQAEHKLNIIELNRKMQKIRERKERVKNRGHGNSSSKESSDEDKGAVLCTRAASKAKKRYREDPPDEPPTAAV